MAKKNREKFVMYSFFNKNDFIKNKIELYYRETHSFYNFFLCSSARNNTKTEPLPVTEASPRCGCRACVSSIYYNPILYLDSS